MMPTIFIMKEGTENAEGKQHIVSNINACLAVAETVRSTLGPRGMDKLIVDGKGKATITNDGATIMNLLDVVHPAARALVDIARSQDAEVGDGTTSVVILSAEILRGCKRFVEDGVHPTLIIEGIRIACRYAVKKIESSAVKIKKEDPKEWRALLEKCAATSLSSKLIATHKAFFAKLVVDAVLMLDEFLPLKMIGIKKLSGGAVDESFLVAGVAFKKAFSYAGFEMQPKKYKNPKIAMLNIELELKAERDNAEIRLDSVEEYQNVVDAEWAILYGKLEKLHAAGVQIVLSKLPIGDVASQYFADRNMFCAGRIPEEDLQRTMMACGGCIITTLEGVPDSVFGTCENFEEIQIGKERFNVFSGCPKARTCTFILRGGAEQFIEETERSLHDAIMIVRRAFKNDAVVAGGGAIDMELACYLRDVSRTFPGKNQLVISTFARAFEIIPRELCTNAGFDSTNVLNKLRQRHSERIAVLKCIVSVNEAPAETSVKLALLKSQASHQNCSAASGKLNEELILEYDFNKFNVNDLFEINVEIEGENLPKRAVSFPVTISPVESGTNQVFAEDGSDKPVRMEVSHSIKSPGKWYGIDINNEDVTDNFQAAVWEPALVKINIVKAASEAVCLILGTDQTIKIPKSAAPPA